MLDKILVLDYGSQYTQLIARRVRELGVYCEIQPFDYPAEKIRAFSPKGLILSGGPSSVYAENAPVSDPEIFELGVPVLGICYGLQMTAHLLGGKVEATDTREYGRADFVVEEEHPLFDELPVGDTLNVWMSHGDLVRGLPEGFRQIGQSPSTPFCAIANDERKIYGLQFHPEVTHTPRGKQILKNFLFNLCEAQANWTMASFVETKVAEIREQVGDDEQVVLGLSGGVDSSVAAVLLHKAIGDRLQCIFVDNGLLRKNERDKVENVFHDHFHMKLDVVDARERFLERLAGVTDPETKRKIIGEVFIRVFEEESRQLDNVKWLAQGTLYPDVIESVSFKGPSAVIKSHHNVGGLPERMHLELIEPLRELFKDEVRELGRQMDMPEDVLMRQPFPGPGLAVRILGEITAERLEVLQDADDIVIEEIKQAGWYRKIWQSFAVLLPVQTVGVMGDERTYADVIALRAVHSTDGMTADWVHLPYDLLAKISNRIVNEVRAVNRVVYDITSKPPGTIEWE